ncbi:hypothetical protein FRB93_001592 [Tulasnella sp. JGI-2019a]|nr:hypothetical protein FRB93_001592 [Tulasnella sp. JGI-2019a]
MDIEGPLSSEMDPRSSTGDGPPRMRGVARKLSVDEPAQCPQAPLPPLTHTLHHKETSVLSLAADERWIFSGSQGMSIYVWDRDTFQVDRLLEGHTGSVLSLELSAERKWLFSSSGERSSRPFIAKPVIELSFAGDSTIRIWSTESLTPIFVLTPFDDFNSGDIFSLAYAPSVNTLFFGCQNTSLQWFDFSTHKNLQDLENSMSPNCQASRKPHKFFDSQPQPAGRPTPSKPSPLITPPSSATNLPRTSSPCQFDGSDSSSEVAQINDLEPKALAVPPENRIPSAHHGYVYCTALVRDFDSSSTSAPERNGATTVQLVTGSGDEDVKLWSYTARSNGTTNMKHLHTFHSNVGAVLSILSSQGNIFAGCQDGHVKIWDLETKTLVRTIIAHECVDILSLSILDMELYVCSANGCIQRYSSSFELTGCWKAHAGAALSSVIIPSSKASKLGVAAQSDSLDLITGASDNKLKVWAVQRPPKRVPGHLRMAPNEDKTPRSSPMVVHGYDVDEIAPNDTVIHPLSQFISFPSVSNHPGHAEDCRQAAIWLKKCFTQLGAESQLLYGVEGMNPVVLGNFRGTESKTRKPRILFYGHYDVIASGSVSAWDTDPFSLTGLNGYLYGRGVSDNKGPILAVACAASEMLARRALDIDLIMLIEGEEEAGSTGFAEAVAKHKDLIGHIDGILVSNSYWIDDARPCITYGLRGVVHAMIDVIGKGPDVHSGVDGGAATEPMMDMVKLLARLSEGSRIAIPGFYDNVRPRSKEEDCIFKVLADITGRTPESFSTRWTEPSLSVHSINDSGLGNSTVIPGRVRAKISLRIVPDQDPPTIINSLEACIKSIFADLQSPNSLGVHIDRTADWWIGNLDHPLFQAMDRAIEEEWGIKPLRIREGGSIPSVPWLEKAFSCPAVHLPMGQSSDHAHLRNERISLNNLRKGKAVISRFLEHISL